MVFGKLFGNRDDTAARQLQIEFLDNCLIQIEGLKDRVGKDFAAEQKAIWPGVWDHDDQAEDLLKKIALAESFATQVDGVVRGSGASVETTWDTLKTLQDVIDNCETSLATIMSSLLEKQKSQSSGLDH